MDKAKKSTDEAGTKPAEQLPAHDASGKRPIWSRSINRVEGSMWKHGQNGDTRYTVSVSRHYLNRRTNEWKRDHYFDRRDLADVVTVCREAEDRILQLEGMTQAAGED